MHSTYMTKLSHVNMLTLPSEHVLANARVPFFIFELGPAQSSCQEHSDQFAVGWSTSNQARHLLNLALAKKSSIIVNKGTEFSCVDP